jgi:hypothetical protein
MGGPPYQRQFEANRDKSPYRLEIVVMDAERLKAAQPEYLVLSQYETADLARLMMNSETAKLPDVRRFMAFMDIVRRDYEPIFDARNRPALLPPAWLPSGQPPHDWLYPYPEIRIWKRKGS